MTRVNFNVPRSTLCHLVLFIEQGLAHVDREDLHDPRTKKRVHDAKKILRKIKCLKRGSLQLGGESFTFMVLLYKMFEPEPGKNRFII